MGRFKSFLVGKPLASHMASHERISKVKALAVLSSDALSSVAYATEEILIPLTAFSAAAISYSLPIAIAILALLIIITLSYRQTISAYPSGGGAYIVAKENLGVTAGLVAGASLLIDYVLTVAVSVSAGIENIGSAVPMVWQHKELFGILVILIIMILNLRGIRESAKIFSVPTYFFIGSFGVLIISGFYHLIMGEIPPLPTAEVITKTTETIPIFLLLKAFSSGCSALTGVEAISNGIPMFEVPEQKNAKITMMWMSLILGVFFISLTTLTHFYGIVPQEGQTIVSLLARKAFGQNIFYYVLQFATALILVLAANTSYADFPRLASLLANDRFLPRQFSMMGDRLVFSNGILGLSLFAILLIVHYGGDTHHLIPLYAIGVFLSFTLSQLGMVVHHLKIKELHWKKNLLINLLGAITTFIVLLVIGATKFIHGAWIVCALIPAFVYVFKLIHSHYEELGDKLKVGLHSKSFVQVQKRNIVVIPVSNIHNGVLEAVSYSRSVSSDVRACYVEIEPKKTKVIVDSWNSFNTGVSLIVIPSPYRSIMEPLLNYVINLQKSEDGLWITVVIPEFIVKRWWENFLHNQSAFFIRTSLSFRKGIIITSVRYHLD